VDAVPAVGAVGSCVGGVVGRLSVRGGDDDGDGGDACGGGGGPGCRGGLSGGGLLAGWWLALEGGVRLSFGCVDSGAGLGWARLRGNDGQSLIGQGGAVQGERGGGRGGSTGPTVPRGREGGVDSGHRGWGAVVERGGSQVVGERSGLGGAVRERGVGGRGRGGVRRERGGAGRGGSGERGGRGNRGGGG
jgi:hypothetical protein